MLFACAVLRYMARPTVDSTSEHVRTNVAAGCVILHLVLQAAGNYFQAKKETAGSDRQQRREQSFLSNAAQILPFICAIFIARSARNMLKNLPN